MTGRDRRRQPATPKPAGQVAHAALTADEYRALIQKFVDRAREEQSIAERLAEEARLRFGADIDVPTETE